MNKSCLRLNRQFRFFVGVHFGQNQQCDLLHRSRFREQQSENHQNIKIRIFDHSQAPKKFENMQETSIFFVQDWFIFDYWFSATNKQKGCINLSQQLMIKALIIAVLCATAAYCQPPGVVVSDTTAIRKAVVDPVPSTVPVTSEMMVVAAPNTYDTANNAWNNLQALGGGCCDKCNTICGMAIRTSNNNYYLGPNSGYVRFDYTTSPSIYFTLGQNSDCTWSFSYNNQYLGISGSWVKMTTSLGLNERWYIERSGSDVYVQSASQSHMYWTGNPAANQPWLSLSSTPTKLTMEFMPCNKLLGWN